MANNNFDTREIRLTVEDGIDEEGRARLAPLFYWLTDAAALKTALAGHHTLSSVQQARDAVEAKEVSARQPSEKALVCAAAVLEHSDMYFVELDKQTAEAARTAVSRELNERRAARGDFDLGVGQLRAIANEATTRSVVVIGLDEQPATLPTA